MYVYCVESFAHIECYSDYAQGEPFGFTPLLRCGLMCVVPSLRVVFSTHVALMCLVLCKEEGSSPVSAITERRYMDLYEVPLSYVFGMGTMLANFHMCGIMLVLDQLSTCS